MPSFIERVSMIRERKNKDGIVSIGTFLRLKNSGDSDTDAVIDPNSDTEGERLGYIIQAAFGRVCIIDLDSGNRYEELTEVKDVHSFYLKEIADPNEWEVLDV